MKLAPLVFVLVSVMAIASTSAAEPPKVRDVYTCVFSFSLTRWSKAGVKQNPVTEGPLTELIEILDAEVQLTSFFRGKASTGHYPITLRDDDSIVFENPTKDGHRHPGEHVLYRMTDQIAVYTHSSGSYRNGDGGITIEARNGTCRLVR